MDEEVERHRLISNSLECELQALRQRMLTVECFTENTNVEQTEDQLSRLGLLLAFFMSAYNSWFLIYVFVCVPSHLKS